MAKLSDDKLKRLLEEFDHKSNPTRAEINRIAGEIDENPDRVYNWFPKERQRRRNRAAMHQQDALAPPRTGSKRSPAAATKPLGQPPTLINLEDEDTDSRQLAPNQSPATHTAAQATRVHSSPTAQLAPSSSHNPPTSAGPPAKRIKISSPLILETKHYLDAIASTHSQHTHGPHT